MAVSLLLGAAVVGEVCTLGEWQQKILDQHNTWRASTSPPAKDMNRIRWDSNIERNMASWLSSCDPEWPHSDQNKHRKDVGGYEFLGENLAYCAGSSCPAKLADGTIGHVGQGWWDEKDDYDYEGDRSTGGITSHYTQMASSNIYAVGCAARNNCPGVLHCALLEGNLASAAVVICDLWRQEGALRVIKQPGVLDRPCVYDAIAEFVGSHRQDYVRFATGCPGFLGSTACDHTYLVGEILARRTSGSFDGDYSTVEVSSR